MTLTLLQGAVTLICLQYMKYRKWVEFSDFNWDHARKVSSGVYIRSLFMYSNFIWYFSSTGRTAFLRVHLICRSFVNCSRTSECPDVYSTSSSNYFVCSGRGMVLVANLAESSNHKLDLDPVNWCSHCCLERSNLWSSIVFFLVPDQLVHFIIHGVYKRGEEGNWIEHLGDDVLQQHHYHACIICYRLVYRWFTRRD